MTLSVRLAVVVPLPFTALKVYVSVPVAFGVTLVVPEAVVVEKLRLLPEIATELAFVVFHESVTLLPSVVLRGEAEKEETVGAEPPPQAPNVKFAPTLPAFVPFDTAMGTALV